MEFAFTMQCFYQQTNVFLVRQAIIAAQLPIHLFYFSILQEAFYCHFYGQNQEWKKKKAPHMGRYEPCARKQTAYSKTTELSQTQQVVLPQIFQGIYIVIIGKIGNH